MQQKTKEAIKKAKDKASQKKEAMKTKEKPYLDELKSKLTEPFPKKAEQIKKVGSLRLTGFKPAYIIERLNECFGYKGWVAELQDFSFVRNGTTQQTSIMIDENCVTVWVKLAVFFKDDRKWRSHNQFGTCEFHKGMSIGEAIKGAYTDGLKKCAGYFDIGQEAYKGNVEPFYNENKAKQTRQEKAIPSAKTSEGTEESPSPKQVKFLQQHKLEVPKTKAEATELIGKRLKELQGRKEEAKATNLEDEVKRLSQPASNEQKQQLAYYEDKYPDLVQDILEELKLSSLKGITVKGLEVIMKKLEEALNDLGIFEERVKNE